MLNLNALVVVLVAVVCWATQALVKANESQTVTASACSVLNTDSVCAYTKEEQLSISGVCQVFLEYFKVTDKMELDEFSSQKKMLESDTCLNGDYHQEKVNMLVLFYCYVLVFNN